jgi:hypothetical protein
LRRLSSVFDRFLPASALASVDAVLLPFAHPNLPAEPLMRHGPKKTPRNPDPRSTPPDGIDSTRAGIRALDCGEDPNASATTVIRRDPNPVTPEPEMDARELGEQRQSV